MQALSGHLGDSRRTAIGIVGPCNSPRAAEARDSEYGGPRARLEVLEERCDKQLRRGRITAGVGDALGGTDRRTTVEF